MEQVVQRNHTGNLPRTRSRVSASGEISKRELLPTTAIVGIEQWGARILAQGSLNGGIDNSRSSYALEERNGKLSLFFPLSVYNERLRETISFLAWIDNFNKCNVHRGGRFVNIVGKEEPIISVGRLSFWDSHPGIFTGLRAMTPIALAYCAAIDGGVVEPKIAVRELLKVFEIYPLVQNSSGIETGNDRDIASIEVMCAVALSSRENNNTIGRIMRKLGLDPRSNGNTEAICTYEERVGRIIDLADKLRDSSRPIELLENRPEMVVGLIVLRKYLSLCKATIKGDKKDILYTDAVRVVASLCSLGVSPHEFSRKVATAGTL